MKNEEEDKGVFNGSRTTMNGSKSNVYRDSARKGNKKRTKEKRKIMSI